MVASFCVSSHVYICIVWYVPHVESGSADARACVAKRGGIGELGGAWLEGHGLSVGSETTGRFSRVRRAARSLQMQTEELLEASYGLAKTATLTMLARLPERQPGAPVEHVHRLGDLGGGLLLRRLGHRPLVAEQRREERVLDERVDVLRGEGEGAHHRE